MLGAFEKEFCMSTAIAAAPITLPPLPYAPAALEPYMSRETLEYHYGKHHKAYVEKLNALIKGTKFQDASLEELVLEADGAVFNNAAQVWNHTFFWNCLSPKRQAPGKDVVRALDSLGGLDSFKSEFAQAAINVFGSGWAWLTRDKGGEVRIATTADADNPLRQGQVALLTCDVWEHAYYIDHRNDRGAYLKSFWELVNWDFVAGNLAK
jgi:superoxide dismutase, Fe-Mn family